MPTLNLAVRNYPPSARPGCALGPGGGAGGLRRAGARGRRVDDMMRAPSDAEARSVGRPPPIAERVPRREGGAARDDRRSGYPEPSTTARDLGGPLPCSGSRSSGSASTRSRVERRSGRRSGRPARGSSDSRRSSSNSASSHFVGRAQRALLLAVIEDSERRGAVPLDARRLASGDLAASPEPSRRDPDVAELRDALIASATNAGRSGWSAARPPGTVFVAVERGIWRAIFGPVDSQGQGPQAKRVA